MSVDMLEEDLGLCQAPHPWDLECKRNPSGVQSGCRIRCTKHNVCAHALVHCNLCNCVQHQSRLPWRWEGEGDTMCIRLWSCWASGSLSTRSVVRALFCLMPGPLGPSSRTGSRHGFAVVVSEPCARYVKHAVGTSSTVQDYLLYCIVLYCIVLCCM